MSGREMPKIGPQYDVKRVRMGTWLEEYSIEKNRIARYRSDKRHSKLRLQVGVSPLFELLLAPVVLKGSAGSVKYGDVVQVMSEDKALSVKVDNDDYTVTNTIPEESAVVASVIKQPCVRNSFLISDPWKGTEEGTVLNYGDDFALCTTAGRMYLGADYPFGTLTRRSGHSKAVMFSSPENQCRLMAETLTRSDLTQGYPLSASSPFFIKSSATNRSLVLCPRFKTCSILGLETEATYYHAPDWFTNPDHVLNTWTLNFTNIVS